MANKSKQTRRAIAHGTYVPKRRNVDVVVASTLNARERSKNRDRDVREREQWRNRHRPDRRGND